MAKAMASGRATMPTMIPRLAREKATAAAPATLAVKPAIAFLRSSPLITLGSGAVIVVAPDERGWRPPVAITGSEHELECDTVIFAIGQSMVEDFLEGAPKSVKVEKGQIVSAVFRSGEVVITASVMALQSGGLADAVQVRNIDSGKVIVGSVQADGTVLVGGGR